MGMPMLRVDDQRRRDRVPVRLVSTHGSGGHRLVLLNLSTTGLLLRSERSLHIGDLVQVDLPDLGPTPARVMWSDADDYGCQFLDTIPQSAVFAAQFASRRNRPQPVPRPSARPRRLPPRERDDSHALVVLILFLALVVTVFYVAQAYLIA